MVYRRRYLSGQSATTVLIAEKAVTEDKIADKAVGEAQLDDDAVTSEKIQDGEVKSEDIGTQEVETQDIKDGAVTTSKIANGAVTSEKLTDTVLTRPISPGVTTAEIANLAVTEGKIAAGGVTETKIGVGAVVSTKLAGDAVETAKIKDDAVTAAKIASGAVGNTEIAADAVRGTEIQDGAVSEGKVGTNAISQVKMKDDSVGTAEILDDAVTTVKVLDANVTEPKLETDILAKRLYERQLFYDDFLGAVLDDAWRKNGDAGGSATISPGSEVIIITDNDINDFYRLDWALVHGVNNIAPNGRCLIKARPSVLTNEAIFIGIFQDANNFVGFRLDTAVDNNWYAVSKEGGIETATDTGVAATNIYKTFEVLYTGGANIEFRINDVLEATVTTNVFLGLGHPCLKIETLENAVKTLVVEVVLVAWNRIIP